jgi:hypothetical protein
MYGGHPLDKGFFGASASGSGAVMLLPPARPPCRIKSRDAPHRANITVTMPAANADKDHNPDYTIRALASMIGRRLLMMEIDVLDARHVGWLVRIWALDAGRMCGQSSVAAHVTDLR